MAMKLSDLLVAKVDMPATARDVEAINRPLRARLIAQEFVRNGMDIAAAYSTVTGYKKTKKSTTHKMLLGQLDEFVSELKTLLITSRVDQEQALNFLWSVLQTSILDFFQDDGQVMSMVELKKLPRILQRMIHQIEVKSAQVPVLDENKRPMLDDNGSPYLRVESYCKIEIPAKLEAIKQLAQIMHWVGPQVVINNNTTNIAVLMSQGDNRRRRMERIYEHSATQSGVRESVGAGAAGINEPDGAG